jgi:hypothetical protein
MTEEKEVLRLSMTDGLRLWDIFDILRQDIDDLHISILEDGLLIRQMNPSQIMLADLKIPIKFFATYNAADTGYSKQITLSGKPVSTRYRITLPIEDFRKTFKKEALKRGPLTLVIRETNGGMPRIEGKIEGEKITSRHKMALCRDDSEVPKIPDVPYTGSFTIKNSELRHCLKNELFQYESSHVTLKMGVHMKDDKITLTSFGDSEEIELDITHATSDRKIMPEKRSQLGSVLPLNTVTATYNIFYLLSMLPRTKKPDVDINIRFRTEAPIEVSYDLHGVKMTFYLAPRIESS